MNIPSFLRDAARLSCLAMLLLLGIARAQAGDANMEYPNTVVTVAREGYTIAGLVTHLAEHRAFRYGIVLFPG